jgi:hypothetical protein
MLILRSAQVAFTILVLGFAGYGPSPLRLPSLV